MLGARWLDISFVVNLGNAMRRPNCIAFSKDDLTGLPSDALRVREHNACFVQAKDIIGLMNRRKKWYGPESIWFALASDDDIVLFEIFNILSCNDSHAVNK
jgi:hypothetical protein